MRLYSDKRRRALFAVGGSWKIDICSLNSGDEVIRLDTNVPGPSLEDPDDYVCDLSFTADSKFLNGATDSGRITVCCHAWIS